MKLSKRLFLNSFIILATVLIFVPANVTAAVGDATAARASINAVPTVNGLFYGDGDSANYYFLAENPGRGSLYYYPDGNTLYLAVVVDTSVNDNVFGDMGLAGDQAYAVSAGWVGRANQHTADALIKSDNVELSLTCGDQSWTWMQGYIYDADGDEDPREADWLSDVNDLSNGGGTPPPGLVSASSLQWNLNNAADLSAGDWDVTLGGTRANSTDWKSPDDGDNDVTDEGWSTFSATYQWEWPLVYEMSIDVSTCNGMPPLVQVISAHNSPAKSGSEDIPIYTKDYGDAPDSYGTDETNSGGEGVGASHYLLPGGPILGPSVDSDADGSPDGCACTDDEFDMGIDPYDDEDGVTFATALVPGQEATVQVVGTAGAKLDAWIDFDGNGVFDPGEQIATLFTLSGGIDEITFLVPSYATATTYARFRVSSAGGLSPTGLAADGEVEDYVLQFSPTAVELASFQARANKRAIVLRWETATEIDNLGFNLYRADAPRGTRVQLNSGLIPSQVPPGSPVGAVYKYKDLGVTPGLTQYYWLEAVDVYGHAEIYGPVSATLDDIPLKSIPRRAPEPSQPSEVGNTSGAGTGSGR